MITPKLRGDLSAHSVEDGGIRYFDVRDPRSGAAMRLYEHEWQLAQKLDGQASLDEVARWATAHIGFSPSAADVSSYARSLGDLGFFDEAFDGLAPTAAPRTTTPAVPAAMPSGDETDFGGVMEGRNNAPSAPPAPRPPVAPPAPFGAVGPSIDLDIAPSTPASKPTPDAISVASASSLKSSGPTTAAVKQIGAPGKGASSGVLWGLVVLLVGAVGAAVYVTVIMPGMQPLRVRVQAASAKKDVVKTTDGKGKVERSAPITMAFEEEGVVEDVVAAGTDTKPGMTLATLDTESQLKHELADVVDREQYYENQARVYGNKGRARDAKKAQAKVEEKKQIRTRLEAQLGKTRLVAVGAGTVAEVMVTAGGPVTAGAPALKIVDKRLVAQIALGDADKALKADAPVQVQAAGKPGSALAQGKIISITDGTAKVEVLDDAGGTIKIGDEVVLVRSKMPGVIRIPAAALTKGQGGVDQVFVLVDDRLAARTVKVVDRDKTDVLISDGISGGDRVVVGTAGTPVDGKNAVAE